MQTKDVTITENQIVIDRQALLTFVRCLDCDLGTEVDLASAMAVLREPFFPDEIVRGKARKDFTVNAYK